MLENDNFNNNDSFSCEWQMKETTDNKDNHSALYKFNENFIWSGIETEKYKKEGTNFAKILRNNIIGSHGESCLFHLRYFEIEKNGYSSMEKHEHEHVIICVRGKGTAIVGCSIISLEFLDILYIAPNQPHQLINENDEPFGFFCIVNSKRDKPKELSKFELDKLRENSIIKNVIRI